MQDSVDVCHEPCAGEDCEPGDHECGNGLPCEHQGRTAKITLTPAQVSQMVTLAWRIGEGLYPEGLEAMVNHLRGIGIEVKQ